MGLAASQARLLMLTARKSDLELQMQMINQARLQLASMISSIFTRSMNLDPNSAEAHQVTALQGDLQQKDKVFEIMTRQLDTQHQAVQTELDAVSKVISKNIESTFKLNGMG